MSSLARSGTVDRGRAQRARYLGEDDPDDPSDLDDDDSSDARVTMGQEPPEPPLLELDACGLVVKFTPPSGATLAKLLLHAEGGVKREYCTKTKSFVAKSFGAAPLGYYVIKSPEVGQQQQARHRAAARTPAAPAAGRGSLAGPRARRPTRCQTSKRTRATRWARGALAHCARGAPPCILPGRRR